MSREFEKEEREMLLEEDWDSLLEDDDEFDAAVKEEYIKEAEEIEKSLFPKGINQEPPVSEEETRASYERLVALMKKKGIYREDEAADGAVANGAVGNGALAEDFAADRVLAEEAAESSAADNAAASSVLADGTAADAADGRKTIAFTGNGLAFVPDADGTAGIRIAAQSDSIRERNRRAMLRQFKMVRAAGVAVACLLGVFLVTMTSEANRMYIVERVKCLVGDDVYIAVDNDEDNDISSQDESQARKIIEEEIGVKVPIIMYYPDDFEYYDYNIYEDASTASIEYIYNDYIVDLYINNDSNSSISRIYSSDGDEQTVYYLENDGMKIMIMETLDDGKDISRYTAQWERENVFYQFDGRMEKKIFEEIIKNMVYD